MTHIEHRIKIAVDGTITCAGCDLVVPRPAGQPSMPTRTSPDQVDTMTCILKECGVD